MEYCVQCLQTGREEYVIALNELGAAAKLDIDPSMAIVSLTGTGHFHIEIDKALTSEELQAGFMALELLLNEYPESDSWLLTKCSDGSLIWFCNKSNSLISKHAFRFMKTVSDGVVGNTVPKNVELRI